MFEKIFKKLIIISFIWVVCFVEATSAQETVVQDLQGSGFAQEYSVDAKAAIPALIEGLSSREVDIRRNAAFALGELGSEAEPALEVLARAMRKDPDREVRRNAAFALGETGPVALPVLIKGLNNSDSGVRRNVAAALVRIGPPAVPSLIEMLNDSKPVIRQNAAGILGRIGPRAKEAIPALEQALSDEDKAFSWTVKSALRKIKKVTVEDLIDSLNDKDVIIRSRAAMALGDKKNQAISAVPALISCMNDEKAAVRKNASIALAKIGIDALPLLRQALSSPDYRIRKNAAFALGGMGSKAKAAVPDLKKLLQDPNSKVRWCADNALKKISVVAE